MLCFYFRGGFRESHTDEAQLDNLDADTVDALITYFYTGEISIIYKNVKMLIEACEYLQCVVLKDKCEEYLVSVLNASNSIGWCKVATTYNLKRVITRSKEILYGSFAEVSQGREFSQMSLAELLDYVKDNDINVQNEDPVLSACITWIMENVDSRKDYLDTIIDSVRLSYCSVEYLQFVRVKYD